MKSYRLFIGIILVCTCFRAGAQDGSEKELGKFITLSVSHEDGQYRKGETVKVYADLKDGAYRDLRMDLLVNGIRTGSGPLHLNPGRQCILDTCIHETNAVIVSLYSEKVGSPHNLDIGFVVAPEGFRPGFKVPGDLKRYWNGEIAAWRCSKPEVTLTPVPLDVPESAGFRCWSIEISCPEGRPVRGYLSIPENAVPGTLPIFMKFCAAGVAGPWCRPKPAEAASMHYGRGCIALVMNAHGFENDAPEEYYRDLENGELFQYSSRDITTRKEYYFRTMFLRAVRALDYLCTLPEWDGKRVLTYGESQGGAQAAALSGLDRRVTASVLNVPAMFDLGGALAGRRSGWPQVLEREPDSPAVSDVAPYFDAALLLRYSRAEIFCDIGLIDMTCPACGVYAGLNSARGPVHIATYPRRPHHEPYDRTIHEDFAGKILSRRRAFFEEYLR